MTRYLRARICLRRHLIAYLNEDQETACNDDDNEFMMSCSVCSISKISRNVDNEISSSLHATTTTSKRVLSFNSTSIARSLSVHASSDEKFNNEKFFDEKLRVETIDAMKSNFMQSSKSSSNENEKNVIYDVVARFARNDLMKQAKDFNLYEARITA